MTVDDEKAHKRGIVQTKTVSILVSLISWGSMVSKDILLDQQLLFGDTQESRKVVTRRRRIFSGGSSRERR